MSCFIIEMFGRYKCDQHLIFKLRKAEKSDLVCFPSLLSLSRLNFKMPLHFHYPIYFNRSNIFIAVNLSSNVITKLSLLLLFHSNLSIHNSSHEYLSH